MTEDPSDQASYPVIAVEDPRWKEERRACDWSGDKVCDLADLIRDNEEVASVWMGYFGHDCEKGPRTAGWNRPDRWKDYDKASVDVNEYGAPYKSLNGVIAPGYVAVDIDTDEMARVALDIIRSLKLKCLVIGTTHGIHAYFRYEEKRKTAEHVPYACGLWGDLLTTQLKDDGSYGARADCLISLGTKRPVIYWGGSIGPLPSLFHRAYATSLAKKRGGLPQFWRLAEGRHTAYMEYRTMLYEMGYTDPDIREILPVINDFVVDQGYPHDPGRVDALLTDAELATAKRCAHVRDGHDEVASQSCFYDAHRRFLLNPATYWILEHAHVRMIDYTLHLYDPGTGCYQSGTKWIDGRLHDYGIEEPRDRDKTIRQLESAMYARAIRDPDHRLDILDTPRADPRYILFRNGVLDVTTGEISPFTPNLVFTNAIPWEYDPGAVSEVMDRAMDDWSDGDAEERALLEEMVGYCLYSKNSYKVFFCLIGGKDNGKSAFLRLVETMLGKENVSKIPFQDLEMQFGAIGLKNKLANVGTELGKGFIFDSSRVKNITAGDDVNTDVKGKDRITFTPYCKLIFAGNQMPILPSDPALIERRLIPVPMTHHFSKEEGNDIKDFADILGKNEEVMKAFVRVAVDGLKRLLKNDRFTRPKCVSAMLAGISMESDPIRYFARINKETIPGMERNDVLLMYDAFCDDEDLPRIKREDERALREFSRIVGDETGTRSEKKGCVKVFVPRN